MNRRKGVPCGCDADPCGCSPKNHCVKAINNVSPDPNGDLNIKAGAGISISQTGDDEITIVNAATPSAYVEGTNIEFTPSGNDVAINVVDDPVIDGTLTVNGDIIQNGAAYETHAEKVYTTNDYIVMRDDAVGGLAVGDYAGFQVEKYDGTNDGRLVIDRDGVARVGDVGDEQPLLTREESANLNNGALLKWDSANQKAVDEGTVGSDSKPVKIVNGIATAVTDDLVKQNATLLTPTFNAKLNNISGMVFVDNKTVSWIYYMFVTADIAAREVIATLPSEYYPVTDTPVVFYDVPNNRLISGGIGYGLQALFSDSLLATNTQLRISFSYKIA